MTSRTFTASLKPALTTEQIESLGTQLKGMATLLAITHDKDINEETGELVEPHTHLYFEYSTPRKITTIANLLNVDTNFVEVVRNKKCLSDILRTWITLKRHNIHPLKFIQIAELITRK